MGLSHERSNKKTNKILKGHAKYKPSYIVPAVDRAIQILLLLKNEGRDMTIAEISEATGWARSSIHKLLLTLNYHALLDRDSKTKRYSLGSELSELVRFKFAFKSQDLRSAAKPILHALVEYSRETASLSVLRDTQMIFLDVEESPEQVRVSLITGISTPATTTSYGKAVLACLPEDRVIEIIRFVGLPVTSEKSFTTIGSYLMDLATTRKRGYAIDYEDYRKGIVGVSAPIYDAKQQVIGALSLVGPAARITKEKARRYGQKCVDMAAKLSDKLR